MKRPPLIIPVENQVRELDPKLLLAVVAAQGGFTSYIGSHRVIGLRIDAFPRGLYLNKSMTARNIKMFEIMRRLGQVVVSWDEEALVHLPAEIYYSRRLSPVAPATCRTSLPTFPILLDNMGEATRLFQVRALPTTFFIDAQGMIQDVIAGGPMSEALLRIRVEQLLENSSTEGF